MSNTYVVNGVTYSGLEEMPPEVRAQFRSMSNFSDDKDKDGMPDILDNMSGKPMAMQSGTILFDGKTYHSVDEMPSEGRAAYEKALGPRKDENKDGMPDVMETTFENMPAMTATPVSTTTRRIVAHTTSASGLGPVIVLAIVCVGLAITVALLLVLVLNR